MTWTLRSVAVAASLLLLPTGASAGPGKAALGFNLGIDVPGGGNGLAVGGVWHLVVAIPMSPSWSVAFEVGTEANSVDGSRYLVHDGEYRQSTLHAVSTLGLLARYQLGTRATRPYLAGGVHYYTAWDNVEASSTSGAEVLVTATGFAPHFGAGVAFRLGSHWDMITEGLYYSAPNDRSEASFGAFRGGIWFFFGGRPSPG